MREAHVQSKLERIEGTRILIVQCTHKIDFALNIAELQERTMPNNRSRSYFNVVQIADEPQHDLLVNCIDMIE